jgi:aspartyl protease family protein
LVKTFRAKTDIGCVSAAQEGKRRREMSGAGDRPRSPWDRPDGAVGGPRQPPPTWRRIVLIGVLAGVGLLALLLMLGAPEVLDDQDSRIELAYRLVWLAVLVPSVLLFRRYSARAMVRDAVAWIGIIGVLAVGYSFRGELMPRRGIASGDGTIAFRAGRDGHYHVEAVVDGATVRFMVDTGASDVVLTARDARRVGLDPVTLSYHRTYRTANGTVQGAPVVLGEVRVGPVQLKDVRASVQRDGLDTSLLGMSFLDRLSGYAVSNGTLTLRQ